MRENRLMVRMTLTFFKKHIYVHAHHIKHCFDVTTLAQKGIISATKTQDMQFFLSNTLTKCICCLCGSKQPKSSNFVLIMRWLVWPLTFKTWHIDLCLVVFASTKYFTYLYANCKLMSFHVFYLCFPALVLFVLFYFIRNHKFVCKPSELKAKPLGWSSFSERRVLFSVFLIYIVPYNSHDPEIFTWTRRSDKVFRWFPMFQNVF